MQAALRHLGVVNTNERVRRYISDLQKQKQQELEHDIDCICLDCERRQVLGQRKIRRSTPKPSREVNTPLPAHGGTERPGQGPNQPIKTVLHRRRPIDENARRGETKLGRASNLRPGRITLGSMLTTVVAPAPPAEDSGALEPRSSASFHRNTGSDDRERHVGQSSDAEHDGWVSDEHSLHSNLMHYEEARIAKARGKNVGPGGQSVSGAGMQQDGMGPVFEDFYRRNPAALANGWLALSHHRDVPAWAARSESSPAIDSVVRFLIQPDKPPLLGLMPNLKPRRQEKRHRDALRRT